MTSRRISPLLQKPFWTTTYSSSCLFLFWTPFWLLRFSFALVLHQLKLIRFLLSYLHASISPVMLNFDCWFLVLSSLTHNFYALCMSDNCFFSLYFIFFGFIAYLTRDRSIYFCSLSVVQKHLSKGCMITPNIMIVMFFLTDSWPFTSWFGKRST